MPTPSPSRLRIVAFALLAGSPMLLGMAAYCHYTMPGLPGFIIALMGGVGALEGLVGAMLLVKSAGDAR